MYELTVLIPMPLVSVVLLAFGSLVSLFCALRATRALAQAKQHVIDLNARTNKNFEYILRRLEQKGLKLATRPFSRLPYAEDELINSLSDKSYL